jgi:hypothetical protein
MQQGNNASTDTLHEIQTPHKSRHQPRTPKATLRETYQTRPQPPALQNIPEQATIALQGHCPVNSQEPCHSFSFTLANTGSIFIE